MDATTKQKTMFFFAQQQEKAANQFCFDCDAQRPNWVSVNHGIYLCINCVSIHRQLGSQVSQVRSITLDAWNENQLKLLEESGNQKLSEFFDEYDLNSEDIKIKYSTNAAHYYRKMIAAAAAGQELQEKKPSFNDGRMLYSASGTSPERAQEEPQMFDSGLSEQVHSQIKSATVDESQSLSLDNHLSSSNQEEQKSPFNQNFNNADDQEVDPLEQLTTDFARRASSLFFQVGETTKDYYAKASESEFGHKTGDALKRAGTVTKETGSKMKEKLDEMGVSAAASHAATKLSTNTKLLGSYLYERAKESKESFNNSERVSQAKEATKEKLGALKSAMASGWRSFYANVVQYEREDSSSGGEEEGAKQGEGDVEYHQVV